MDEGPFRMPRQPERSDRPADTPAEEPKPAPVRRSSTTHHTPSSRFAKEQKSKKPIILAIVAVAVVLVIAIGGWTLASSGASSGAAPAIDNGKYQAVFFTNGQVYFGKLKPFNSEYMELTNVYYLQAKTTSDDSKLQSTTDNANLDNVTMIKLGEEIHGPEDKMIISKDQVLFYENLKTDGKVAQAIEKYKSSK